MNKSTMHLISDSNSGIFDLPIEHKEVILGAEDINMNVIDLDE